MSVTIDKATADKISRPEGDEGWRVLTDDFLNFLKNNKDLGVGHEGEEEDVEEAFVVDGQGLEYFFNEDGTLEIHGKGAEKVEAAIRKFTKPPEPAGPPPSRVRGKLQSAIAMAKEMEGKGRRKTRAKKQPKRKTRKAKTSTRRR